jgi:hypothetical protein
MPIEAGNRQVFIMNVMIAAKRTLFALLTVAGLALVAFGQSQDEPCPLPDTDSTSSASSTTSASSDDPAQSPEQPKCLELVRHNGMPLCVPCPAAAAHIRHGDADLGPCSKPGNQK